MHPILKSLVETDLAPNQIAFVYLGNEGFLFKYGQTYFLTDPYLSDYTDRNCCTPLVKWVRRYPAPPVKDELSFVDVVTLSHAHYDHADPDTLAALSHCNHKAKYVFPAPECWRLPTYGIAEKDIIPAHADQPIHLAGLTITPIPSAHEVFHQDKNGDYLEVGYLIQAGPFKIFHAGDMIPYPGLSKRIQGIDLAFMPINGRSEYKLKVLDIVGNFTSQESVAIAAEAGAKLLVPMHFDLYDVNSTDPKEFTAAIAASKTPIEGHIFQPGELRIYNKK
jgi:L-ascorbate 6-phosphate lactonase